MVLVTKVDGLRRRGEVAQVSYLVCGDVRVSLREMKVWKGSEQLFLSRKEMQLLIVFLENPKQIFSKDQIADAVWDMDGQFMDDNTVPVNISRLKKKLSSDGIQNVRGIGYIWTKEVLRE